MSTIGYTLHREHEYRHKVLLLNTELMYHRYSDISFVSLYIYETHLL